MNIKRQVAEALSTLVVERIAVPPGSVEAEGVTVAEGEFLSLPTCLPPHSCSLPREPFLALKWPARGLHRRDESQSGVHITTVSDGA